MARKPEVQIVPEELRSQVLAILSAELRIEVENGHFTNPNSRTIQVFLGEDLVTETYFDVADKPEYRD